jgi:hypothetical protein
MTEREVVSLKDFIQQQLDSQGKLFETKLDAIEKATTLAKETIDARLESMNQLREQLSRQADTFVTKIEYNLQVKEIESLRLSRAELSGKATQSSVATATFIAIAGLLVSVIGLVVHIVMSS